MTYTNSNLISLLNDIIELIRNEKIEGENGAIPKFREYLELTTEIGPFNHITWTNEWRRLIWKFGEEFKTNNPSKFYAIIEEKINSTSNNNIEVLEFIKSEIMFHYFPHEECKAKLEELIIKYPFNPEFRHTLGHYYFSQNNLIKGINEYKLALKIEPNNNSFLKNRFTTEVQYLNQLIKEGKYIEGKEYITNIFNENFYANNEILCHNTFVSIYARFQDHITFEDKVTEIENKFVEKMRSEFNIERKKIIEVLGFFSSIVAFILSTVSISQNSSINESIYFILCLGIILIFFNVSLSFLFGTNKENGFNDKKIIILIISLVSILILLLNL